MLNCNTILNDHKTWTTIGYLWSSGCRKSVEGWNNVIVATVDIQVLLFNLGSVHNHTGSLVHHLYRRWMVEVRTGESYLLVK